MQIRRNSRSSNKTAGFSLIEMLVTVVIISILAAVVLPSYQASIMKAKRSDRRGAIMNAAQQFERTFTRTNSYATAFQNGHTDEGDFVLVHTGDANSFTLEAYTVDEGEGDWKLRREKDSDPDCQKMGYTRQGQQFPPLCWE